MIKIKPSHKDENVAIFENRRIEKVGNGACIFVPKEYIGKKATMVVWLK